MDLAAVPDGSPMSGSLSSAPRDDGVRPDVPDGARAGMQRFQKRRRGHHPAACGGVICSRTGLSPAKVQPGKLPRHEVHTGSGFEETGVRPAGIVASQRHGLSSNSRLPQEVHDESAAPTPYRGRCPVARCDPAGESAAGLGAARGESRLPRRFRGSAPIQCHADQHQQHGDVL